MKTKLIITFYSLFLFLSCDPERTCTEPGCMYSDVNTQIEATLSGNLDSIINIGDTIRFYMKIPLSINTNFGGTNYGIINVNQIKINSYFGVQSGGGDSLIGKGEGVFVNSKEILSYPIIYSDMPNGTKTWNYNSGIYECIFIPNLVGKFVINIYGGRLEVVANDNKEWLINPQIVWDSTSKLKVRYNQYLQWMEPSMRNEALSKISQKKCWYCFEVK